MNQFLVLLAVAAFAALASAQTSEAPERPCRINGAAYQIFDRKCLRPTRWEVVKDDGEERVTCRCIGLTVRQCFRCVYEDEATTEQPIDGTTQPGDEQPTTNLPELPEGPSTQQPELPEGPSTQQPELPEGPSTQQPELPEGPSTQQPDLPELPGQGTTSAP